MMSNSTIKPPANIGIIGGGQLGRMTSYCAKQLGYNVIVLDPTENSPAMQVSDKGIAASFSDIDALRKLADECEVLTYEFEHINAELLIQLENEGNKVIPSGKTLKVIQDKFQQKSLLQAAGLPVPNFIAVSSKNDILSAIEKFGLPLVLKNTRGGYDGKGNYVIKSAEEVETAIQQLGSENLMVEEFINYTKELSIVIAKSPDETKFYPVVENSHEDSILRLTKAPALIDSYIEEKVQDIAGKTIEVLKDIGIFCIELFLTNEGKVYINEIAPRPHNTAHYTIEGCVTSQYQQLVRILTSLPLGSTELISPTAMVNILGNEEVKGRYYVDGLEKAMAEEKVYVHFYGKKATDRLKKLGHITACGDNVEAAAEKALKALEEIAIRQL